MELPTDCPFKLSYDSKTRKLRVTDENGVYINITPSERGFVINTSKMLVVRPCVDGDSNSAYSVELPSIKR